MDNIEGGASCYPILIRVSSSHGVTFLVSKQESLDAHGIDSEVQVYMLPLRGLLKEVVM